MCDVAPYETELLRITNRDPDGNPYPREDGDYPDHLHRVSTDGTRVVDLGPAERCGFFSPDGSRIAYTCETRTAIAPNVVLVRGGVCLMDRSGANSSFYLEDANASVADWSPDGSKFLVARRSADCHSGELWVLPADQASTSGTLSQRGRRLASCGIYEPKYRQGTLVPGRNVDPEALLRKYAPLLYYDEQELYFADSAATLTDNYVPGDGNALRRGGQSIASPNPEFGIPILSLDFLGERYPADIPYPEDKRALADDVIDERDAHQEDAARLNANPLYANRAYGRAVRDREGRLWLQYWLWYYYNPQSAGIAGTGTHEGDWELIQFRMNSALDQPDVVTTARHGGEHQTCPWSAVEKIASPQGDDMAVIYVANGSHASYFHAGSYDRAFPRPTDEANGGGPVKRPLVEVIPSSRFSDPDHWIAWPGRWGGSTDPGTAEVIGEAASPRGPAFQGQRWNDPLAFSTSGGACAGASSRRSRGPRRDGPRAKLAKDAPPAPRIQVERARRRALVRYRVPRAATAGRRARTLFITVHAADPRLAPSGRTIRVRADRGVTTVTLPAAGSGPYTVRAGTFNRRGARSQISRRILPGR